MKSLLITGMFFMILYALIQGIYYGSILGALLAICSLAALGYVIYLSKKLERQAREEQA